MPKGSLSPHHHRSKDEWITLLDQVKSHPNYIGQLASVLQCGESSIRNQLKKHDLYHDGRIDAATRSTITPPAREDLIRHYRANNMTILDIAKHYHTSNTTVGKWFRIYNIPKISHASTIRHKVLPKIVATNQSLHGYSHYFGTPQAKQLIANTFLEKYGVPYHPIPSTSKGEEAVLAYVRSLVPDFQKTHDFGVELDMYSPSLKVAIEYCGLFWHTERYKHKLLHQKKYQICQQHQIRLITLFEDEWLYHRLAVQGFLNAVCQVYTHRLYARSCDVRELHPRDASILEFYSQHHIQGSPNVRTTLQHYGLYHHDHLVAAMTKGRHPRNASLALTRYAVRPGYQILGGAEKLFRRMSLHEIHPIISWSDNRWSEGRVYQKLGFQLCHQLPPDYAYVDKTQRVPKQRCTRTRLGAAPGQTEHARAIELNLYRIWDCGKRAWQWTPPTTSPPS